MSDDGESKRLEGDVAVVAEVGVSLLDKPLATARITVIARREGEIQIEGAKTAIRRTLEEAAGRVFRRYSLLDIGDSEGRGRLAADLGEELSDALEAYGLPLKILMVRVDEVV